MTDPDTPSEVRPAAGERAGPGQPAPQDAVMRLLRDPASYPHPVERIEECETHISRVFLAGEYAYKLKKAVHYDFLDYSTPEIRRRYCDEEVRLNRRLAPDVYLGVAVVREREGGELVLDAEGDGAVAESGRPVESLVRMRRLSESVLLSTRLREDRVSAVEITGLVDLLVRFEDRAERGPHIDRYATVENIRRQTEGNLDVVRGLVGPDFPPERFHALRSAQLGLLALRPERFERRIAEGRVRDGHGDLRAEHVAFLPQPAVLDCVEFNEGFRCADVAADLAFLLMDLEFLGHREVAAAVREAWIEAAEDLGIEDVLDFWICYRACVRAKVDALRSRQCEGGNERRRLLRRAHRFVELAAFSALSFHSPLLVLVGGLSGTGKSTLAGGLAATLGAPRMRSDEVRRELAPGPGGPGAAGWAEGRYAPEVTRRVYDELGARARELLDAGSTVVLDATFSHEAERRPAAEAARASGARLVHLECRCPAEVAARRMTDRAGEGQDVSEATPRIQEQQRAAYEPPQGAVPVDTRASPAEVHDAALARLRRLLAEGD